jgi:hypothetical protein
MQQGFGRLRRLLALLLPILLLLLAAAAQQVVEEDRWGPISAPVPAAAVEHFEAAVVGYASLRGQVVEPLQEVRACACVRACVRACVAHYRNRTENRLIECLKSLFEPTDQPNK